MEIIVYSDESGTFDKIHNDIFVFGGIVFLGTEAEILLIESIPMLKRLFGHLGNMLNRKN